MTKGHEQDMKAVIQLKSQRPRQRPELNPEPSKLQPYTLILSQLTACAVDGYKHQIASILIYLALLIWIGSLQNNEVIDRCIELTLNNFQAAVFNFPHRTCN